MFGPRKIREITGRNDKTGGGREMGQNTGETRENGRVGRYDRLMA